jgi:hypothetical protein
VAVPDPFRFAVNLHVYAAGKRDLRNRLQSPYVPEYKPQRQPLPGGKARPNPSLNVARVQYAGGWDPEPSAWTRFSRLMGYRTGTVVGVKNVALAELSAADTPFAHMTGIARHVPTEAEVAAMRKYVEEGGVLLIDNCGPGSEFTRGLDGALRQAFDYAPEPIPPTHPLLNASQVGMESLSPPAIRKYALDLIKSDVPPIRAIYFGKGTVLVSQMDVVSGLLGTATWGIMGYAPKWCEHFMQNAILWTMDGQPTVSRGVMN